MKKLLFGLSVMVIITFLVLSFKPQKKHIPATLSSLGSETPWRAAYVLDQNCGSCHALDPSKPHTIAPSFAEIKAAYKKHSPDEEGFKNRMVGFLKSPSAEQALLQEAVQEFGIMPNLGLSTADYEAIAAYMFDTNMESAAWYDEIFLPQLKQWNESQKGQEVDYLSLGKDLSSSTKVVIGKNLIGAINTLGTEGAVDFCNERAIPLTDSMATVLQASIKRVSDKNRNALNKANPQELQYMLEAKKELRENGVIRPISHDKGDKVVAYYPIITNDMCLQCHGKPQEDIKAAVLEMIQQKYPNDQATGYGAGELRGIWVVEMMKEL